MNLSTAASLLGLDRNAAARLVRQLASAHPELASQDARRHWDITPGGLDALAALLNTRPSQAEPDPASSGEVGSENSGETEFASPYAWPRNTRLLLAKLPDGRLVRIRVRDNRAIKGRAPLEVRREGTCADGAVYVLANPRARR